MGYISTSVFYGFYGLSILLLRFFYAHLWSLVERVFEIYGGVSCNFTVVAVVGAYSREITVVCPSMRIARLAPANHVIWNTYCNVCYTYRIMVERKFWRRGPLKECMVVFLGLNTYSQKLLKS